MTSSVQVPVNDGACEFVCVIVLKALEEPCACITPHALVGTVSVHQPHLLDDCTIGFDSLLSVRVLVKQLFEPRVCHDAPPYNSSSMVPQHSTVGNTLHRVSFISMLTQYDHSRYPYEHNNRPFR